MAGVGFELRRMIEERRGMIAKVRAYSCAGLISSGPWLMTILTLTLLNLAGPYLGGTEGYSLFRALVTYAFAFSLILQGIAQMAVTRRVADLLYTKRYDAVLPAFVATIVGVGVAHGLIGAVFCVWAGFSVLLSFLAVTLFTIIGMTWIALIWLTVVRQYDEVLRAYVYGTLVAMVGVLLLFLGRGTVGILAAYTGGQAFTLALLLRTIVRGMNASGGRDLSVFRSLVNFPMLVGVGLFYNAAIWVDKMIFWFQDGVGPHRLVRYHPLYDTCSFLAYLTVVPALAVNLVRLETAFYERYRAYYGAILGGTPLAVIEDKRRRMLRNLEEGMVRLLKTQGAITALVILFAPVICETLKLPPIAVRLFRLTCLGGLFHVLLLINILMQMYFDLRKQALATSLTFFALNGLLAWWSVNRGVETYGIGYALASFLSLLLGYLLLYRSLDRLDYMTFTSQPIGSDEERREATVLAEQERAAEKAAATEETGEEEEEPETPAPIVVAAGEMAPPEAVDEVPVEAIVIEEQETVPDDVSRADAGATATDVGAAPSAVELEPTPAATLETATDLPGEPRIAPPETAEAAPEPAADAPAETATDLPGEPRIARPETAEAAPEPATDAPAETATDLPGEPRIARPAAAELDATATEAAPSAFDKALAKRADDSEPAPAAPPETATDAAGELEITRPTAAESDATATEVDPSALDAAADDAAEELEFVGFGRRAPRADTEATATEVGSSLDDLAEEIDDALDEVAPEADTEATATDVGELSALEAAVDDLAAQAEADLSHEEPDEEATETDVGELSALEAAVEDLAAQVEADPLQEEPEADATATDVAGLSALNEAVDDLAAEVDADRLDEEAEGADEEPEEEPKDTAHSQIDIVRPHFGKRPAREPSDETEAE